jgi:methylmalonyl-CoA mutase C-terminal domain/subunit
MARTRLVLGKVVLAKVGLDGHDVGIKLIAKHLVQAGFEVVYLGKRKLPDDVVAAVIEEDASVAGVSSLSGGLGAFAIETIELLTQHGVDGVPVIAGGVEEPDEVQQMLARGVHAYFGPTAPIDAVVDAFRHVVAGRG